MTKPPEMTPEERAKLRRDLLGYDDDFHDAGQLFNKVMMLLAVEHGYVVQNGDSGTLTEKGKALLREGKA